jgi:hypothetical protein
MWVADENCLPRKYGLSVVREGGCGCLVRRCRLPLGFDPRAGQDHGSGCQTAGGGIRARAPCNVEFETEYVFGTQLKRCDVVGERFADLIDLR